MTNRQLFQQHLAPTSTAPIGLEIVHAEGNYLYDIEGKKYLDLIGGISVCNIGHRQPEVIEAIHQQLNKYMHIMVYGELVQAPQSQYAQLLTSLLPPSLNCVYFTNSGSEATEGALKLARRVTGKTDLLACNDSYHGHTMGALSIMGSEYWRAPFRPLLPAVRHYGYNSMELVDAIGNQTACVVIETVQAEAGVILPNREWLQALRDRCTATCTLLIFDEIQCGFGRTGTLWGFEHWGIVPDVLLLGKALGGGMPMGAFVASREMMSVLAHNPVLGHLTTFGGHPVCCAAGMASLQVLLQRPYQSEVDEKGKLFISLLEKNTHIVAVKGIGLLIAIQLRDSETVQKVLALCLHRGLFSDWFLFAPDCIRIAPPLSITKEEIVDACDIINEIVDNVFIDG